MKSSYNYMYFSSGIVLNLFSWMLKFALVYLVTRISHFAHQCLLCLVSYKPLLIIEAIRLIIWELLTVKCSVSPCSSYSKSKTNHDWFFKGFYLNLISQHIQQQLRTNSHKWKRCVWVCQQIWGKSFIVSNSITSILIVKETPT